MECNSAADDMPTLLEEMMAEAHLASAAAAASRPAPPKPAPDASSFGKNLRKGFLLGGTSSKSSSALSLITSHSNSTKAKDIPPHVSQQPKIEEILQDAIADNIGTKPEVSPPTRAAKQQSEPDPLPITRTYEKLGDDIFAVEQNLKSVNLDLRLMDEDKEQRSPMPQHWQQPPGCLVEAALKKHTHSKIELLDVEEEDQKRKKQQEEQEAINSILLDDELRTVLLDPAFQEILEKCTHDARVFYTLRRDPVMGPKLHRMEAAGLISVQR